MDLKQDFATKYRLFTIGALKMTVILFMNVPLSSQSCSCKTMSSIAAVFAHGFIEGIESGGCGVCVSTCNQH